MNSPAQFAADARLHLGLSPDQVVPDIVELIRKADYHYHEDDFADSFSAVTRRHGSHNYLICYNTRHQFGTAFKRFTLAHELGHINMHTDVLHGDMTSEDNLGSTNPREIEANKFAAHFLMPKAAFVPMAERLTFTPAAIRKLAEHFQVSEIATAQHFVENTDLACSLIVCNSEGRTVREVRSEKMARLLGFPRFVCKTDVPASSLAAERIRGASSKELGNTSLLDWMPQLSIDLQVEEGVIQTPDNLYLVLLTPYQANPDWEDE